MKFSKPLVLFAAFSGACSMVIPRDSPLTQVMKALTDSIRRLDDIFLEFKNDNNDIRPVVSAIEDVIGTIESGQMVAEQCDPISIKDALPLIKPVKKLNSWVKKLLGDMKMRRPVIQTANACNITRNEIVVLNAESQKLIDTVHGKLKSKVARSAAKPFIDGIKKRLTDSEATFSKENCVNGG